MVETKYGKYFLHELNPEVRQKDFGNRPFTIVWTDDDILGGAIFFGP